jgi:hypothetical protein
MNFPSFDKVGEKLVNRFFRRVDEVVWDLMSGRVGVRTSDNEIATLDGEGDAAEVVINPFGEFGVPVPAFAQSVPVTDIKQGDLIYNAKKVLGWVIGTPNFDATGKKKITRTFKLLKPDGTRGEWSPAKLSSMGLDLSGAMVLRSLINMLPGSGLGGLQGMLMPMLMMGGDLGDMEQIMPMMLMSQMGMMGGAGGAAAANPMAGMFQMMMFSKMMSGKSGSSAKPGTSSNFFDR